jgi:hypothetical protein
MFLYCVVLSYYIFVYFSSSLFCFFTSSILTYFLSPVLASNLSLSCCQTPFEMNLFYFSRLLTLNLIFLGIINLLLLYKLSYFVFRSLIIFVYFYVLVLTL